MPNRLPEHEIVLLGAGHTNCYVLRMWRMRPIPGCLLTCVSDFAEATYSGMLPGTLAGLYDSGRMRIDLVRLCAAAGARLIRGRVEGIEPRRRLLLIEGRPPLAYSLLSIGIGSVPGGLAPLLDAAVLPIKPMQTFLDRLDARLFKLGEELPEGRLRAIVVGSGAGGVEIAWALRFRARKILGADRFDVMLFDASARLRALPTRRGNRLVERELARRGIQLQTNRRVRHVENGVVHCEDGSTHRADLVLWSTSAGPAPLLQQLSLPKDAAGFLRCRTTLQVVGEDEVFAVGDCAAIEDYSIPKAGVYAVRQGPILWENLQRALAGRPLLKYRPQRTFLKLLSLADGRAILSYGPLAVAGKWCWRLKDYIDSRFMAMYQDYSPRPMGMAPNATPPQNGVRPDLPCAGCGSKVGSTILRRVLERLHVPVDDHVLLGLSQGDDAAVLRLRSPRADRRARGGAEIPPLRDAEDAAGRSTKTHGEWIGGTSSGGAGPSSDRCIVVSHDFFTVPVEDPFLAGRIAAVHAANDVIAMGSYPFAGLAAVSLPRGPVQRQEECLYEVLAGAAREFEQMGATLVGGHTIESDEFTLGFTMLGDPGPRRFTTKAELRPDDVLLLTKPLGVGVLLAAHMRARCRWEWYQRLLESMLASSLGLLSILHDHDIRAVTDVSGFGLAGHLEEMLSVSRVAAELDLAALPLLPGVEELVGEGLESTLAPANRDAERVIRWQGGVPARTTALANPPLAARYAVLFDPQTCGGMLMGVPSREAPEVLRRMAGEVGVRGTVIGRVFAGEVGIEIQTGTL